MSRPQQTNPEVTMDRTLASESGYVTLSVLLIAGLLAAIVSSLLAVSRPALGLARIGGDEVASEALLQGGVSAAAFLLLEARREADKVDGETIEFGTGEIRLSAVDEAGRVDLNSADPTLLAGLFAASGCTSMSAEEFAARVVDWRDEDGDVSEGGAESGEYAEAEVGYAPSNLPFHSVEEMAFLLRLSRADFDRLTPFVTVFSGKAEVDPLAASETVLRAIPGATRNDVLQVLRARRSGLDRARILERVQTISSFLLDESSGVYRVGVEARLANGFSENLEAIISSPPGEGGGADYRVVAWSPRVPDISQ